MRIQFVDRLHERGWIDRWAFLLFSFVGSIGIIFTKALGASAIPVAAVASILIVLFAAIQDRRGTGRLRSDQAGDNCYYLGLIYTLASLAYTIFAFDPSDPVTTIVSGFGIALTTTIIGLILRVFFNQSRADLVEVEDTTRIELADAAGRLKAVLSQVSVSMNDLVRQMRQSIDEMRTTSGDYVKVTGEAAARSVRDVAAQAAELLKGHDEELAESLRRLKNASDKAFTSLDSHADHLSELNEASRALADAGIAVRDITAGAHAALEAATSGIHGLRELHIGLQISTASLQETSASLGESVRSLMSRISELDAVVSERTKELRAAPAESLEESAAILEEAIATVADGLKRLLIRQTEATERFVAQLANAHATAERHSEALEAELARSRENTAKVHAALVEMTSELVRQVELRTPA